jgi:hypothetical protein
MKNYSICQKNVLFTPHPGLLTSKGERKIKGRNFWQIFYLPREIRYEKNIGGR